MAANDGIIFYVICPVTIAITATSLVQLQLLLLDASQQATSFFLQPRLKVDNRFPQCIDETDLK